MRELDADSVILGEGYPSFVGDRRGPAFPRNCLSMIVLHRSDQFSGWWGSTHYHFDPSTINVQLLGVLLEEFPQSLDLDLIQFSSQIRGVWSA